jgi:alkylation response protein AidB-like acyl-CoA dehydrogenase
MTSCITGELSRYRVLARRDGLVAAFTALCAELPDDALTVGPSGYALLPVSLAGPDGRLVPLDADGLVVVRRPDAPPVAGRDSWLLALAWLRLGVSEGLRDATIAYLSARRVGDTPLLLQQMVKGELAEAAIDQLEAAAVLDGAEPGQLPEPVLAALHRQVTQADRRLLRLLGASGFTSDGPGQAAYVSELLADVHVGDRVAREAL